MRRITLTVNGVPRQVDTEEDRPLLEVLREDLDLTGTHFGCGEGRCRACTVLLDGRPVTSCRTPIGSAEGAAVTTIEGLATEGRLHPVQEAFLEAGAMQCGYCVPGMILTTVALLDEHPSPTEEEVVRALNGNLCRCCGYPRVLKAVQRAVARRAEGDDR